MELTTTVGEYLINQLYSLKVRHVFGIPGDYVLGFYDQLVKSKIKIVNTCDEQGAGFAADAYARINGLGAVCVTYCVGGLKLLNSTAQAYAEKSPVVIISGSPGIHERKKSSLLHHKIRDYDTQYNLFREVTIASTILNDIEMISSEIERVLSAAVRYSMPVYIELPRDMVYKVITSPRECIIPDLKTNHNALKEATEESISMINSSIKPVIVAGVEIQRFGLQNILLKLLDKTGIPFVSTPLSKSVIRENHPLYLGVYEGAMGFNNVRDLVESSDCVIMFGTFMTDIDFGNSPTPVEQGKTINATSSDLSIRYHNYEDISLRDFLLSLLDSNLLKNKKNYIKSFASLKQETYLSNHKKNDNQKITANLIFQILDNYLTSKHIIISDVGDSLFGGLDLLIKKGTEFLCPAYYLSMGFAIPAAIGAQFANERLRPIVLVGDGAFQMTGVEISTIAKFKLNPIIVLLNNDGYRTERTILDGKFNDLYPWKYHRITQMLNNGKSYFVKTVGQFVTALEKCNDDIQNFSLIEVSLERFDSTDALQRITKSLSKKATIK
ncbi:MAG: preprotein translocase subunit Tim44 [Nitrososphaeraceae archaeon]|nr:preprotein translocase subunit Tim44 [Nitrososphaeraceae archaeon]